MVAALMQAKLSVWFFDRLAIVAYILHGTTL
jgi:hypothetical protein